MGLMRISGGAVLASVVAYGAACGPAGSSRPGLAAAFHDGTWALAVDRALRDGSPAAGSPAAPFSESDFAPATGNTTYRLDVSEQGARIVVAEPRLVAHLEATTPERLTYRIVEGTFADGRIVIWPIPGGLQGELTIYGSGRPVIRSERGSLRRVR